MADCKRPLLLAAVCDFGWGSLGKLRLILERVPAIDVALYGNANITKTTKDLLGSRHTFGDRPAPDADAAVVINDPIAANQIADLGVPVIYIDSLPYLWTTATEVPNLQKIAYYCAQKFPPQLPVSSPLRDRHDIHWIDPIVPAAKNRHGGEGIVISVGGLHSHLVGAAVDAYLSLVLFALVETLNASGRKLSAICGNLGPAVCQRLKALAPQCRAIGPQTPHDFEHLLKGADLLITSPGSTTILHAMSIKLPTLLLPPQNLSQILNAQLYAAPDAPIMQWPASILVLEKIEELRPQGEDAVLGYIYTSIANAAASASAAQEVAAVIHKGVHEAPRQGVLNQSMARLGSRGANQVAQLIKQAVLAPIPRDSRGPRL